MLSKYFRLIIILIIFALIFASQQFFLSSPVKGQESEYWSIDRKDYFSGNWVADSYQCPKGTFRTEQVLVTVDKNFVEGVMVDGNPCIPAGNRAFAVRLNVGAVTSNQNFQATLYFGTPQNPSAGGTVINMKIVDQNTFVLGLGVPYPITFKRDSSIQSNSVQPDYSVCSYYDEVAKTNNCKYHALAGKICRDDYLLTKLFTSACSRLAPGEITIEEKNCIRSCLVLNDQVVREQVDFCQINCNGETCTKRECIDAYHNSCFELCNVSKVCYGGNWPYSYDNDDKKCSVSLNSGVCIESNL